MDKTLRNERIDLLRFIGLALIILAHSTIPKFLFQLRNFDVPLMILVSGMSFGLTFKKHESYVDYIWKRIKRILLPTWIFLTIFFPFLFVFNLPGLDLSFKLIWNSYFLLDGLRFVWIIRVFLLVSIAAPIIYNLSNKKKSDTSYLIKMLLIFLIYDICRYFALPYISEGYVENISLIILYIIPYSLLFALGLEIPKYSIQKNIKITSFFGILFLVLALLLWNLRGNFVPTQIYKYPPSIYFFSYAIAVSTFFWLISGVLCDYLKASKRIHSFVMFSAQNSLWIYFWHIPFVDVIYSNFIVRYLVMFFASASITFLQVWFVKHVLIEKVSNVHLKKNLKILLTG
ncbi:MAG: acyltransferase [Thermosynechococcaceae cyanobacterium]